ncbi:serine/threonine protein phosphatase [Thiocystis violascens DSM 198]|uniref:Serine/threonine protein phosphatase n=1 Tax=Thiocystis violascens (strain ATCC 17096 / DSM 198 / 6111) TaxID=765911 RepID=I3YAJ2_THIV6|nr:serine/threonine protein phosphatase [Thiocystis violascens DSM 198]
MAGRERLLLRQRMAGVLRVIPFRFQTATLSHPGARANNEDVRGHRDGCWVVADGLGGHGGGEVAAQLAVDSLLATVDPAAPLSAESLMQALTTATQAIHARQRTEPRLSGMRTTVVMLVSDGTQALWAHLGDSRLYGFRAGRIVVQTADHSVPQALVRAGELAPEAIRFHEDRNRLLRTLGDDKPLRPTLTETPWRLQAGDAFLLCTDGFWESVTEAEMEIALAKSADPAHWLALLERGLQRQARADQDNYSAIALFVESAGSAP